MLEWAGGALADAGVVLPPACAQVDGFSARIKPEPKDIEEEEEEGIGDVDLFALNPEAGQLSVNAKWLQHLQVRGGLLLFACSFCRAGSHRAACCTAARV